MLSLDSPVGSPDFVPSFLESCTKDWWSGNVNVEADTEIEVKGENAAPSAGTPTGIWIDTCRFWTGSHSSIPFELGLLPGHPAKPLPLPPIRLLRPARPAARYAEEIGRRTDAPPAVPGMLPVCVST